MYNLSHICVPNNLYNAFFKVLPHRHGIFCSCLLTEDESKMRRDVPEFTNWTQHLTIYKLDSTPHNLQTGLNTSQFTNWTQHLTIYKLDSTPHNFHTNISYYRTDYNAWLSAVLLFIFNYALQPSRLIVLSGLDVPTFATRRLHACHHARAPSGGRWNCGREMSGNFA